MIVRFNGQNFDLELSSARKFLHDAVDEMAIEIENMWIDDEESDEFWEQVQKIHNAISEKDVEALTNCHTYPDGFDDIMDEVKKDLKDVLEESGYNVQKSCASSSLYIKLNPDDDWYDEEAVIRISDHKRPGFAINEFSFGEHEYGKDLINKKGEFTKQQLEDLGLQIKSEDDIFYI